MKAISLNLDEVIDFYNKHQQRPMLEHKLYKESKRIFIESSQGF